MFLSSPKIEAANKVPSGVIAEQAQRDRFLDVQPFICRNRTSREPQNQSSPVHPKLELFLFSRDPHFTCHEAHRGDIWRQGGQCELEPFNLVSWKFPN